MRRWMTLAAGAVVLALTGCVNTGKGTMGLDFGEVLAKEQEVFTVNGERAALRRYVNGSYDIKLYGPAKVMDLGLDKSKVSVANVADVGGATLITLDAPEADCAHVYHVYQVAGTQSKAWETSYRSCEGPLTFQLSKGQWTARQAFVPSAGKPYMLVYQGGELYVRPLTVRKKAAPKAPKRAPVVQKAAPAAVNSAPNLDDVRAPTGTNLDDVTVPAGGSNLDDIEVPTGTVSTKGLKADRATSVQLKDD